MIEFLRGLASRPRLLAELLVASLLINLLGLASTGFVMLVLGRYVPYGIAATLMTLTIGVVLALLAEFGLRQARRKLAAEALAPATAERAAAAFAAQLGVRAAVLDRLSAGVRADIPRWVDTVERAHSPSTLTALLDVPFAAITLAALLLLNPALGAIAVVFTILSGGLAWGGERWIRRRMAAVQAAEQTLRGASDSARAVEAVRAFNAAPWLHRRWSEARQDCERQQQAVSAAQGLLSALGRLLAGAQGVAVIAYGAVLCVDGHLSTAQLIGANILAGRAIAPLNQLAQLVEPLARAAQALRRLAELAKLPREQVNGNALARFEGRLELTDVAFAYPGAVTPLAEHLSLSLPAGGILLVAGPSGAGKTTFARLLLGLAEPLRGHVLIDGLDLRQLSHEWWRRQVCYLPQEPDFFDASIADNLRLGRADLDDAALYRAIGEAGLRPWLDTTAQGLATRIEESGRRLPPGIRRRLGLARALVGGGRLCLFDDPAEGLDAEARNALYDTLRRLAAEGRTLVICGNDPAIARGASLLLDLGSKPVPRLLTPPERHEVGDA